LAEPERLNVDPAHRILIGAARSQVFALGPSSDADSCRALQRMAAGVKTAGHPLEDTP
jgi:hypothetical protein